MKTYSTEAGTASALQISYPRFRSPLKVLQNLQLFHNCNMSSRVCVSSPSKTSVTKQKKGESNTYVKESHTKSKPVSVTSSKISSDKSSSKTSHKSPGYYKKQEVRSDLKSKFSESSDGSVTSVGSLTSSPKWSHIKKKFESGELMSNSKSSKTASVTGGEMKRCTQSNRAMKNTSSGNTENVSFIHRNKYLSSRKFSDKKNDAPTNKSDLAVNCRTLNDKPRLNNSSNAKNETLKSVARCSSPKNSSANIPAINASALHSSSLLKNYSGTSSGGLKTPHSSTSGSSESILVKNSRSNSPNTTRCSASSSSPTSKHFPSKSSLSNIPVDKSVNFSSSKISATTTKDGPNKYSQSSNISNLNSSVLAKKTSQDSKGNSYKGKQKFEDKPILTFNNSSQEAEKSETTFGNKTSKKLLGSESSSPPLSSNKTFSSKNRANSDLNSTISKTHILENVEKIKDLTKNSLQRSKTIWVKDSAGNWVKKADSETKKISSSKTISNSKVASLRSKFMESSKDNSIPLTKSSTTSSVPSKNIQNNRPLMKSNTTSNICDKVFLDDLTKKLTTVKNIDKVVDSQVSNSHLIANDKESQGSKTDNLKLNIVQRAVLSYEGSLALLSPETQKRLKVVSEKVQAQTDDDKILRAKTKINAINNFKNVSEANVNKGLLANNVSKKATEQNSLGEPVLPVRNFLNRYQQMNKALVSKDSNKISEEKDKIKTSVKQNEVRSTFTDISSTLNKKETKQPQIFTKNFPQNTESVSNRKSVTKLTMNFELPNEQIDVKSQNQENDYVLQPNSSFLWRRCEIAPSQLSKSSTASSVSLTSSDYRNYYDIENYYSSLELEIDKRSENSEDHIYIDSQGSNSSENNYASSISSSTYQNMYKGRGQNGSYDEWTDISDDDYRRKSVSSNQSSTLKKRKNKRHSGYRDTSSGLSKVQTANEQKKQHMNDTISFTDSSDTLINDEVGNESTFDMSDINHFYEPVYESLGNYLLNQNEGNEENCSISLSPDEPESGDFMHCSLTSLESTESNHQETEISKSKDSEDKSAANKKSSNKISQLKRHLSWTKNDIRFELSSKFNKIKIKKNGSNSTEIGLKMQDNENANTSPKKKTFIKCILRQKSASSIPIKRSPSPKKESALFYVHLTMGREKQRPVSDSVVSEGISKDTKETVLKPRKQSDSGLTLTTAVKYNQQLPRSRKFASSHMVQRPKTPPPLPPVQAAVNKHAVSESLDIKAMSTTTLVPDVDDVESPFYALLDPVYVSAANRKQQPQYENEVLKLIHANDRCRTSISTFVENIDESDAPSDEISNENSRKSSNDLNLPLLQNLQAENLKSPFEEEPMYQFYQKDVQQRATLWFSVDGSESEFEDDISSRLSDPDYQSPKRPVLQSQLSAMDLVHGDGGQRRLWCEVPEVVESGILKTIPSNNRKIQEAMFEVITSEASYLKSLNFLIEHFVQCAEFSGDYSEKHILDKRERHILFSDIQPVRDVSASLLADLEKRWMKYIVLSDICDILYHNASKYFSVYVKYCSNQLYQERLLRELKEKRPEFVAVLKRLESNPVCQGLNMHSFLMLPMQRITRMPLLIDAIFRRLTIDSPIYESCKIALATVNKIVAECNEGACKMQRMEEMLVISQQIDFKACKGLGLLSASRWLVKKGELIQLLMDNSSRRTFGRSSRWCKIQLYLFLFTDLLVVTRKKGDDNYSVVDYCPRNMLQVMPIDENTPPLPMRLPSSYRNVFQLIMLNNRDGKTVEMLLSCLLESDRTRWMNAVRPAKSENPDEKIYEEWDCPQVQCTHAYNAQQPDELSLEEADVVNVFKKMSDGWFEGERIRDGIRGWFPSSHTVEIINSHVRARNLHQRYRLLMLSQTYLEEQHKAQAQQTKK